MKKWIQLVAAVWSMTCAWAAVPEPAFRVPSVNLDGTLRGPTNFFSTNYVSLFRRCTNIAQLLAYAAPSDATMRALVDGYLSSSDNGGGEFVYSATSSASTNLGTVFAPASGGGRWLRRIGDAQVVLPEWFGALPNDAAEDTAGIQAAIDYAESNSIGRVYLRPGTWIAQVTLHTCSLEGRKNNNNYPIPSYETILLQPANPTAATVTLQPSLNAYPPTVKDIKIVGRGSQTTPNKKAITAVVDRLNFKVADADAPALYPLTDYPSQVAFFYTSENNFLGSGFVTGISSASGQTTVTLDPEWTQYATTGGGSTLTTGDKVVFSPSQLLNSTTYVDPAAAGYAGIYYDGQLYARLENVSVLKHHVGLRIHTGGSTPALQMFGMNSFNGCEFASIAAASAIENVDLSQSGLLYMPGSYLIPTYGVVSYPAETNTITNPELRRCQFGFYQGIGGASTFKNVVLENSLTGIYQSRLLGTHFDYLFCDLAMRHPIVIRDGYYNTSGHGMSIDFLWIKSWETGSFLGSMTNKAAIRVDGTLIPAKIHIGALQVTKVTGAVGFDHIFDIAGGQPHDISVGRVIDISGASTDVGRYVSATPKWLSPYDATTAADQANGWYMPAVNKTRFSAGSVDVAEFGPNGAVISSPGTVDVLKIAGGTPLKTMGVSINTDGFYIKNHDRGSFSGIFYGDDASAFLSIGDISAGTNTRNASLYFENATATTGADVAAKTAFIVGPRGTGSNSGGGEIRFQTADVLGPGAIQQPSTTKVVIRREGQLGLYSRATAPSVSFANGDIYYNTTRNALHALVNNAWKDVRVGTLLTASGFLDFPSTAAGSDSDLTMTVTGAAVGNVVYLGIASASVVAGGTFTAWVSAADTVTVRFSNYSGASKDPASGIFNVRVEQ